MNMEDSGAPHVALLPSPGMGHFIPLAEFAKRLISHHGFSVTFISVSADSTSKTQKSIVDALPANVNSVHLPPVSLDDLPSETKIETRITLTVRRSLPAIRDVFCTLRSTTRFVALVADIFGTDAFDLAAEFSLLPYIFFPSNAHGLSYFLHSRALDKAHPGPYRDLPEPVQLPGCYPIPGSDVLDPLQDKSSDAYQQVLYHGERYKQAKAVIVNTFDGLEPDTIAALRESGQPPVYPVGPLTRTGGGGGSDCEILKWLDGQPLGSVLFVSFGSAGTLSHEQLCELACGLEMSEQRFVWVVRSPHEKEANGTYFSVESSRDPFDFLPAGFAERTRGSGLVVPSWAPQVQVLSHGSTAGFLTHCGWNSTLESVVHGVPMIAWPLFAEQKMNAVVLVDGLKVALRPKAKENGLIGREEIARVVKALMEGEEGKRVRNKMKELKESAFIALGDSGSSTLALARLSQEMYDCKLEKFQLETSDYARQL